MKVNESNATTGVCCGWCGSRIMRCLFCGENFKVPEKVCCSGRNHYHKKCKK